jgi:hypothetical protein
LGAVKIVEVGDVKSIKGKEEYIRDGATGFIATLARRLNTLITAANQGEATQLPI